MGKLIISDIDFKNLEILSISFAKFNCRDS